MPHAALAPSGQPIWLDVARRTAQAVHEQWRDGRTLADVLTPDALENAMLVHAAFGGSTNLLIHVPAIAHAAGLARPTVDDWRRVNRAVPRLVDALPNGPENHPTVRVFLAGGVPEVMLHLRRLGLLERRRAHDHGPDVGRPARRVGGRASDGTACASACGSRTASTPTT